MRAVLLFCLTCLPISQLVFAGSYGANPDYPVYPPNIDEILWPDKRTVCDAYSSPNKLSPTYLSVMSHIDDTYTEGDHQHFFFKYMLTMNCWPFRPNFFDNEIRGGDVSHTLGSVMKSAYDGIDPNAFIHIEREGKVFEGPIYHVYEHLEKNYRDSPEHMREYVAAMKRLRSPRYQLYPVKSLQQIRRDDPAMPIRLP